MNIARMMMWPAAAVALALATNIAMQKRQHMDIKGTASVIDGDTIIVGPWPGFHGVHIRLDGIDAEERSEPHGDAARYALIQLVDGHKVTCVVTGTSYDRVVGICRMENGTDIGAEMVRQGVALDCARYSGGRYSTLEPLRVRQTLRQKGYC